MCIATHTEKSQCPLKQKGTSSVLGSTFRILYVQCVLWDTAPSRDGGEACLDSLVGPLGKSYAVSKEEERTPPADTVFLLL